jgi:hypothetical protein
VNTAGIPLFAKGDQVMPQVVRRDFLNRVDTLLAKPSLPVSQLIGIELDCPGGETPSLSVNDEPLDIPGQLRLPN